MRNLGRLASLVVVLVVWLAVTASWGAAPRRVGEETFCKRSRTGAHCGSRPSLPAAVLAIGPDDAPRPYSADKHSAEGGLGHVPKSRLLRPLRGRLARSYQGIPISHRGRPERGRTGASRIVPAIPHTLARGRSLVGCGARGSARPGRGDAGFRGRGPRLGNQSRLSARSGSCRLLPRGAYGSWIF